MRSAAVLSAALLAGVAAGAAFADVLPPIPGVTTPTVTSPVPLPVPVPSLPSTTVASTTVSASPVPITTPSVGVSGSSAGKPVPVLSVDGSRSSSGSSGGGGSSSGGSGGAAGGSSSGLSGSGATARSGQQGMAITRLRASRPWVATTGPAAQRKTILHFRLARRARVVFTVTQIAPECRVVGRFAVKGRAGLNKVAFSSRVDGHRLAPGTYRIAARVGSGRTFLRVVVVVFATAPSPTELDRARRADVCASSRLLAASAAPASGGAAGNTGSGASESPPASSEIVRNQASHTSPKGHVSAAPFSPARIGRNATNPLVLGALGLAVLLLGVAALPQRALPNPRLTDVVARHRVEVALAGGGALAAALLALALS